MPLAPRYLPAAATSAGYRHGSDTTITRKNIDAHQDRLAARGHAPLGPAEITELFDQFPKPRHYARAAMLMARRRATEDEAA